MALVYVVGFQPANDRAAVGGFDWYHPPQRGHAIHRMVQRLAEGVDHFLTFVPLEVPDGLDDREIDRWIDENLQLVEVGRQ